MKNSSVSDQVDDDDERETETETRIETEMQRQIERDRSRKTEPHRDTERQRLPGLTHGLVDKVEESRIQRQ